MEFFTVGPRRYGRFERVFDSAVVHAFSTRPHDVAARPDADAARRAEHRAQMARDLQLPPGALCFCQQVHEDRIAVVDSAHAAGRLDGVDAAVTDTPQRPLMTFSADCPLILLHDPTRRVLALVHASWRCTVARLARQTVARMTEAFGCTPAELRAGIGPGAGPCCYEVGPDVLAAAAGLPAEEQAFERRAGRVYFDLWQANRAQLLGAGLKPGHVELAGVCTMCRSDLFYSYRREGAGCGHFGLMAALP